MSGLVSPEIKYTGIVERASPGLRKGFDQGHVVSREMLTRDVWKEAGRHSPLDNVIDVHVARLRRKIDDQFAQKLVHTVRGVGFVVRCGPD